MSPAAQQLLQSFEDLSKTEKQAVAFEILRRTDVPPLSDEDLVMNAEAVFLELDQLEEAVVEV